MEQNILKDLKNALESGEFNSEAATRINQINKLADMISSKGDFSDKLNKFETDANSTTFEENEDSIIKMKELKLQDEINSEIANLSNLEDDLLIYLDYFKETFNEINVKYNKELVNVDPLYEKLLNKIDEIRIKFSTILQ